MYAQQKLSLPSLILGIVLGLAFLGAVFMTIYNNLTSGSTDFYPTWKAAELFFKEGISPYDERIGVESQDLIYGRPAQAGEDLFLYFYPFYVIFYFAPLVLVSYQLAAAIYMQLLFIGLLLVLGLNLHLLGWLPPPLMLALLILFTMTSYFSARGILLAQHALLAYVGHGIALWGIYRKRDTVTGLGLVLALVKPQTGILIVPLLLLWAWRVGRHRLVFLFGMIFIIMLGLSFLLEPPWLTRWIDQVRAYEGSTETLPMAHIVTHFIGGIPRWLEDAAQAVLSGLLLLPVVAFWKRSLVKLDPLAFLWGYCLTMTVTVAIIPRTATTYYVELYPALYITAMLLARKGWGTAVYLGGLGLLIGYWALHIVTVPPVEAGGAGKEAPIVYVVFPLIMLGLLFTLREQWLTVISPLQANEKG